MHNYQKLKDDLKNVSNFLVILGDQKRQAIIIKLLEEKDCEGLQVGQLTEATGLSRPAISHHLKILKDAEIVDYRSNGTKNYYYLTHNKNEILKLKHFIDEVLQIMEEN